MELKSEQIITKMKDIKLVAIDIDDTLLNGKKEISEKTIESIKKCTELGIKIVLASGRPLSIVTEDFYKKIGLFNEGNLYIAYNGESIYDIYSKKIYYQDALNIEEVREIDQYFVGTDSARYVHLDNNTTVINPNGYSYIEYKYNLKPEVEANFLEMNEINAHKYQVADEADTIKKMLRKLPDDIKNKYSVMITMPCFLEFMKNGIDKYQGILKVCEIYGFKEENIMAIGDSMNDLSMIKNASIGVAMKNSIREIWNICDIITDSNNNDGVSKVLELLIKNR